MLFKEKRVVHVNEPITVKFLIKNPLMSEVKISDMSLCCGFKGKEELKIDPLRELSKDYTLVWQ